MRHMSLHPAPTGMPEVVEDGDRRRNWAYRRGMAARTKLLEWLRARREQRIDARNGATWGAVTASRDDFEAAEKKRDRKQRTIAEQQRNRTFPSY